MNRINLMAICAFAMLTPDGTDGGGLTGDTNANEAGATDETNDAVKELTTIDGIKYVKEEFKVSRASGQATPITGWGFAKPCYPTTQAAIEHLDALIKEQGKEGITGEQIVLDLMDTALSGKLRIRVKAATPSVGDPGFKTQDDVNAWFTKKEEGNTDKLLFTPEEAHNWIPGLRELSARKQLEAKMEQVKDMITKLGPTHPDVQKMLVDIATSMAGV